MTPHDERGQDWPPPSLSPPPAEVQPPALRWSIVALGAGIVGVFGAMLPALLGQKVGDPDSWAYQTGVPLGLAGGFVAVVSGWYLSSRCPDGSRSRNLAVAGLVVGLVALFLTAALVFSG